ncbi:molybdopterin-dependent oxidoreductase [Ideonella sp. A 288]|uniref:molybdopterin-dependent oxidoreductase n=1 Tax=Ideonella sp. A 288 TaxID=1962181 RepID=UPI000B4AD1B9|nr:molybdopterin-dependent oxidoreductase [Ideonella sp. A 288]
MVSRRSLVALSSLPLMPHATALALEAPVGDVVLTVTGKVSTTNRNGRALFDMAMLEHMPQASYTTRTPWYVGPRRFTGPLLRDVLQAVGAQGRQLRATALNDYHVEIPVEDARRWDVIVARLLDGKPMTVRDKGPLFVMYPFDEHGALRSPLYFSRCTWQLTSIEVM